MRKHFVQVVIVSGIALAMALGAPLALWAESVDPDLISSSIEDEISREDEEPDESQVIPEYKSETVLVDSDDQSQDATMGQEDAKAQEVQVSEQAAELTDEREQGNTQGESAHQPSSERADSADAITMARRDIDSSSPTLSVQAHVANLGWRSPVGSGETAGTTGQNLALEALRINLAGSPSGSRIEIRAHVSNIGWQEWKDGEAGTTGKALAIEALQVRLTGPIADSYDVWYRVHSADFGWLGWAKNGVSAGSQGYAKAAQAVEILLVSKGDEGPKSDGRAFRVPLITYSAHVSEIGWQGAVKDGEIAGTTGRNLPLEALRVSLGEGAGDGSVEMRAHVSNIGWQEWSSSGMAGTTGRALSVEAISLRLTGTASQTYDIWYRVHSAEFGWLGWTSNGKDAGSSGWARAVQAVEVRLLPKGSSAPGSTGNAFVPNMSETSFAQLGESTTVAIRPASIDTLRAAGATEMQVTASMSYGGAVTRSVSGSCKLSQLASQGYALDFGTYGPFSVTVTYRNGSKVIGSTTQEVPVVASEYNLAPLSASFPVVLFSLSYWDIDESSTGSVIPTIVMLDRPSAYDWDHLPQGMYAMPYLSENAIRTTSNYQVFADYVRDLHRISPNATFNLYINDITCTLIHQILYANKIPSGQYHITLLSDGSATYLYTNEAFAVADPRGKQSQLISQWNVAKQYAYDTGSVADGYGFHEHWDSMYAVLTCEPGTEWWMTRTNLFTSGDNNQLASEIASSPQVKAKNVANMLAEIQGKDSGVVSALKALYNFNDGYFTSAEEQGKTPMVLLGTYVTNEEHFEEYADMAQIMYGDEFAYYYKGHPNTPTGLYPQKQAQLDQLGITDVDSSVAAELILFFNPEVMLCGYGSSTFNSATADMAGGLFDLSKEEAMAEGSSIDYSGMDWFATPITSETNAKIQALCQPGHSCFLIEFSDDMLAKNAYDIAVYDAQKSAITFFASGSDGSYQQIAVKRSGTTIVGEAHVADLGWRPTVKNGGVIGTTGRAKALEALKLTLQNAPYSGSITYQAHVSEIGWQKWVTAGSVAGTTGKALPIEALRVELTGEMARHYDVWYRTHVQNIGWMGWTSNGEMSGTSGKALPVEAVQVVLVEKGGAAPGDTQHAFEIA